MMEEWDNKNIDSDYDGDGMLDADEIMKRTTTAKPRTAKKNAAPRVKKFNRLIDDSFLEQEMELPVYEPEYLMDSKVEIEAE